MSVTVGRLNVALRRCAGHCVFTVLASQKAAVSWLAVCRFEHVKIADVFGASKTACTALCDCLFPFTGVAESVLQR